MTAACPGAVSLTWAQVLAWRMRRQFLAEDHTADHTAGHTADHTAGAARDAVAVARRLAGVQAQVSSSAEAAIAVRGGAPDAGPQDTLVRTWAMRGTLHLLPVDVAPSYLALLASARSWEKGAWQREFASAERMAALARDVEGLLADADLTRAELVDALDEPALASGWSVLLKPLAWQGLLVQGATRDGRSTFAAPRRRHPAWPDTPALDDAARTVIDAYLGAHGPASPETFDAWLLRGATPRARLRAWFADLLEAGVLARVDVAGDALLARAVDLDDLAGATAVDGVRLLPAFDQYVLGPGTAHAPVVAPEHRREVSRAAGWIAPVVVAAGRVVGTWAIDDAVLAVEPFADTDHAALDGLERETERWSAILDRDVVARVSRPRP